jgi:hypothetical protein
VVLDFRSDHWPRQTGALPLAAGSPACAQRNRGALTMEASKFIGTWSLVRSEFRRSDGEVIYPYGEHAVGLLIYGQTGHMSAQVARRDRPPFVSGDWLDGTPDEIKAAFEGFLSYFGTYQVDEQQGTVVHHICASCFPNWAGRDQTRYFEFADDRLTLRTPPIVAGGATMTGYLIWDRATTDERRRATR